MYLSNIQGWVETFTNIHHYGGVDILRDIRTENTVHHSSNI